MRHYLKTQSHAFEPEMIQVLAAALDDAWRVYTASAVFDGPPDAAAREAIAKSIIGLAMEGERDRNRLVEAALLKLKLLPAGRAPDCKEVGPASASRFPQVSSRGSRNP